MKRSAMKELLEWKKKTGRKPLIIRGVRQSGKTWLMKEFGKTHFNSFSYINFDNNSRMQKLFSGDYDIKHIISGLELESGVNINPENTLIILDEIQECASAISSLKYFNENAPEYMIVAAGSQLGIALHSGASFPVGKVEFLELFPMSYFEFIRAAEKEKLLGPVDAGDFGLTNAFSDKYIELLRNYYFTGGMPEAVAEFINTGSYEKTRQIQKNILLAYEQDFSKHIPAGVVPRLRMLWNSIPAQLSKENHKFIYGLIRHGARAKEYETALTWLSDYGLSSGVKRIRKPGIPLKAYEDNSIFKLYISDVGLLGALCGLDAKSLLEGNRIFTEFKGALSEQYVFQELKTLKDIHISYWTAEKGLAEVDFIVQSEGKVIPFEVKAEENLKAKSLRSYRDLYKPSIAVRASMSGFKKDQGLLNIPLYLISCFQRIIRQ
ncbi:MAG: ATPase [Candidatus Firestonebacteria bacterium RIFOXYC2_FULL_39_67]|nr:MAG: ATPase [Candidatus Firestonebacteria bacterium RIFOXYD2_FULL_39_29]OGF54262.1 MAG: ATPase [Candidatus Firestonebacteria bacterium RIFOXYC2_FULL_39_67]OGF56892.1 MAG: ATPase [Candidatus Firestonebacteria bacterium RifOxyC12_full_39_7]